MLRLILFYLAFVTFLLCEDTGTLTGKITDKKTKNPLPGVQVYFPELGIGNSTDLDGKYLILNIPPGDYLLKVSCIAYEDVEQTLVIEKGVTLSLDFQLKAARLESSNPYSRESLFNSRDFYNRFRDKSYPIRDVHNEYDPFGFFLEEPFGILNELPATVVVDGTRYHRGYRKSAVDHLVNGVSIRDPITGTANLHFQQSLGDYETEFKPGGLDARYGSTRGGIVSYQMLKPRNKRTSSVLIGTSNGVSKTKEDLLNWEVYHASSYRDKLYCSLDISGYESKGYRSNESFSSFNYALNASYRISSRLKISTFYLNQQLDYQDGYNHDYSLTISEDRQSQFLPHYLIDYDMADNGYRDGMVDLDDIPPELLSWLNTPGLQQEDTDDDNRVDLFFETETYTDWNNNGQFDPGEWFIDVNGDGMYSEFLNEDIDGDGDNRMEDLNNNWWLDSESIFDSWYGNGSLDTEDLNFNGILDPGEDLNNDGLIQSEDINHDGEMSRYSMFSRLPWHQENREIVTFKVTFQPTPKIYGWFQYSRYNLKKLSNTIEYVNEDRNYNDLLDDGEDLNGNGILDPYHHGYEIEGARDSKDMFSDYNNDGIVDQSVRDNDLDGDIDEDDWIYWDEVYTTLHWWQNYGMFRGVSTDRPNGYPSGGWSYDKYAIENIQLHYVHQYNHKGRLYCGFDHSWYDLLHNNEEEVNSLGFTVDPTPVNTAGYISTRYEVLPTFSFTAGFRFDLMTSAEDRLEDSWDPTWSQWDNDNWGGDGINQYYNEAADDAGLYIHSLGEPRVKHRNKYAVKISPRVGLNFSPSFGTTLFVNYGHYRTKPYFLEELLKYNYDNRLLTRSFEFGVRHKINRKWFTEFLIYDSVEYDTRDIYLSETARPFEFYLKGQQVKLFWYPSRLLNVELTYLHSNPEFYSDEQEGYSSWIPVIDAIRYNAEWSQKHTVFGKLDLGGRYRKATIVFNYGSGTKYTIPGQGADITLNSGELPSKYWFDGMISSTHHVGSWGLKFILVIHNLFDYKFIENIPPENLDWYYTFYRINKRYKDGEMTYFEYMAQVDMDRDGSIDRNKRYPEQGSQLDTSVYNRGRRITLSIVIDI